MFEVYFVGGERDGEVVGRFDTEAEAIKFARRFEKEHEDEFDELCGGVGISGPNGEQVEW